MKGYEGDSYLQTSTGIQRHRLRALFGRVDIYESFFKAGGTAGIQAEVAEEDPAPERQFVFPGLFSFIGNYVL